MENTLDQERERLRDQYRTELAGANRATIIARLLKALEPLQRKVIYFESSDEEHLAEVDRTVTELGKSCEVGESALLPIWQNAKRLFDFEDPDHLWKSDKVWIGGEHIEAQEFRAITTVIWEKISGWYAF